MQALDIANLTLPEILLWLLTYAVVYGVLSQVGEGLPKSKAARSIIAIVAGFLVLMSQPTEILTALSTMAGDMLLVLIGLLVFIVFIEMTHLKGEIMQKTHVSYTLFIILVVIAAAIFVSAGGLRLLGWEGVFMNISWNTIFFLLIVIAAIWWMVSSEGGQEAGGG